MNDYSSGTGLTARRQLLAARRHVSGRICSVVVSAALCSACAGVGKERTAGTIQPAYDPDTGRLTELAYDSNGNGRIDSWTEMDGSRPARSRIDTNEDGRIDRWEFFDAEGRLVKVGFSRGDTGIPDAWAITDADGTTRLVEISSLQDERKIDRWEYYTDAGVPEGRPLVLSRAEEDTNGDGRPDKWETYENGSIRTVAFDESGNGVADRRLTYDGARLVLLEFHPDTSGRFARRVRTQ